MKSYILLLTVLLITICCALPGLCDSSVKTAFLHNSDNQWAYEAVTSLANKGLVNGYDNAKFLSNRTLTRYEFASIVDRIAQSISDKHKVSEAIATGILTQDDLNKIQVLTDTFHTELNAIESDVNSIQADIAVLRKTISETKLTADKALSSANNAYGAGTGRNYTVSGFVQARYQAAGSTNTSRFVPGNNSSGGAYNGNYAQNGSPSTFQLRRACVKFAGILSRNASYGLMINAPGAINSGTTANQQIVLSEGALYYTFGDGSAKYPTLVAGQFPTPFGYLLPLSPSVSLLPDKPLAFSCLLYGPFPNADFDKGMQFIYGPNKILPVKIIWAVVNGTGKNSENTTRNLDQIYRIAYQKPNTFLNAGISYYHGKVSNNTGAGPTFYSGKKELLDFDIRYIPLNGAFIIGEYLSGAFEQRSYFNLQSDPSVTTTFAPGNHIEAYCIEGGYTYGAAGNHPTTIFINYDVLRKSTSGVSSSIAGGPSGNSFNDVNFSYGFMYNLDKTTRLRILYDQPQDVAHANTGFNVPKIGLFTADLQTKY